MDLIAQIRLVLQKLRDAAADGRITIREAMAIAIAVGDLLRIIGEVLPGAAHDAEVTAETTTDPK